MIKNYFITAFRNLRKHSGYSFLNFLGLAVGLAVTIIVTLYVIDDLTFDGFHKHGDDIYRVLSIGVKRGTKNSITAGPMMLAARENIPEVLAATRVRGAGRSPIGVAGTSPERLRDDSAVRGTALLADEAFFDVFGFEILEGEPGEALARPDAVYLTPRLARALFEGEEAVGQAVVVPGVENARVAGIVASPPSNSHIQFDMILALNPQRAPNFFDSWETLALYGYVRLTPGADPGPVAEKLKALGLANNFPEIFEPRLQSLRDVHLGSSDHFYDDMNSGRSDRVVFLTMVFVGILVLLVACVNYVNLTTSRASNRAVEVGLRKVIGANRRRLVGQFLGESALLTTLSFLFSLALVQTALPALNVIMNKALALNFKADAGLLLLFLAASLAIGLLSGAYPAFVLSSFRPVSVIRGEVTRGRRGALLRRGLVIFQFAVTTGLVVIILIVLSQIRFLRTMDLGYNRSNVLAVTAPNRTGDDVLKRRFESLPGVVSVGRIDALPGPNFWRFELIREGHDRSENFTASRFAVDEDTFRTLEIDIGRGRGFSREFPADALDGIIVNETLVRKFGYEEPIGTVLRYYDENNNNSITARQIVGVIRDFHYVTARQASEPMIFLLDPRQGYLLLVRVAPGKTAAILPALEKEFKAVHPDRPFSTQFLDDTFNAQFSGDKDFMRNIGIFAGLAIFIAALGLVGLAAFSIERRRKEIAIRKVLGSGERKVFGLLVADFAAWVLLANLVAWPAAYFAAKSWLADFTFRAPFQFWTFGLASLATLFVALLTVTLQSLRAIRANPAKALRDVG